MPHPSIPKPKELTPEITQKIHSHARALFEYLAGDIQAMRVEMGESPAIPRDEVLEFVLDADRLTERLDRDPSIPQSVRDWMDKASYRQLCTFMRPAFPYGSYE